MPPKKKVNTKSIKLSQVSLKAQVEKLSQKQEFAERAVWTVWGLVSTWNPYWAENQKNLLTLIEDEKADVVDQLFGLLKRKDDTLKLKALGALAQLPYFQRKIKRHMAQKPFLLDRMCRLLAVDISNSESYHQQQLQVRAAKVLASISSTPFADYGIPNILAHHPGLLDTLIQAASGGARPVTRHEVIRILYNMSFSLETAAVLRRSGAIERVLLPVLDGNETGPCVAMRTLWAIVAIANMELPDSINVGKGKSSFLHENEVQVLVSALDASLHDGSLDELDAELYGSFGCVDISEAHDASLRIYPLIMLIPLRRLSLLAKEREIMIDSGICKLMLDFVQRFLLLRKLDYDKAVRQAEARRKVAAATGSADGEQDIGPQPPKPTQGSKVGAVEDDFGLPALDSEEDNQQRRSVLECLDLICCLSASPQGARKLHVAGAVPTVAKLMINRNACVREQVCVTIETVSSAASVAAALHRATSNGRDSSLNAASSEAAGGGGVHGTIEDKHSEAASDYLASALFDAEHSVRLTAAHALGKVFMPSHRLASKRVLKALDSADAGVRQAAVGALGSMHQTGHWRYFTTEWNPRAKRAEGRRLGRDGGLLTGVTNRLFHKNQGTRLSASCAIFEMCSMCKEELALSPRIRSKRQFAPDDCYWGAEAFADEALVRLQQLIDNGSGTLASSLSPIHSPIASMTSVKSTKGRGMMGPGESVKRGAVTSPAESGRDGSMASKRTGQHHKSSAGEADGKEDEEDPAGLRLEGVRLIIFLLGHVCPLSRRTSALALLYQLLGRVDLTSSSDESKLPPISKDLCSSTVEPQCRAASACPLATFQALVNITTAWSEGTEDDAREFSKDFREQFVDFSGRVECLKRLHETCLHPDPRVRESSAIALGQLAKGSDRASLDALINLKFDSDPRVVEACVQAVAHIVAGKALGNGTLNSFVGVEPLMKNSKRVLSATRRLQPLPARPIVTRDWMDKVKDLDGDGWHAYIYWSQCFHGVGDEPVCAAAMKRIMDVKECVDALGLPGWIYTLQSLEKDLKERDEKEMAALHKEIAHKTEAEVEALHDKLLWEKEKTTSMKRVEQDKQTRAKEREKPLFSFAVDDDDDDPREQSFFGTKPTELELEERKKKREAAVASRLQAIAHFELEMETLAEKQNLELKKLVQELEDYMELQLSTVREDNAELLDKRKQKLKALQERRFQEASCGVYGDLVWDVVLQRLTESEIFVACLTPQYLADQVCRKEVAKAAELGKTIIPLICGPMPGMYHAPEHSAGVALSGGGIWWPPRDDMGQYFRDSVPVDMFQAVGPRVEESQPFRQLMMQLTGAVSRDMANYQRQSDIEYGAKHAVSKSAAPTDAIPRGSHVPRMHHIMQIIWCIRGNATGAHRSLTLSVSPSTFLGALLCTDAALRQQLFTASRLISRTEWMLKGHNG